MRAALRESAVVLVPSVWHDVLPTVDALAVALAIDAAARGSDPGQGARPAGGAHAA